MSFDQELSINERFIQLCEEISSKIEDYSAVNTKYAEDYSAVNTKYALFSPLTTSEDYQLKNQFFILLTRLALGNSDIKFNNFKFGNSLSTC